MLARAERRLGQAAKLVDKWKLRLADLDRAGIVARQAKLWSDVGFPLLLEKRHFADDYYP
jgi:hypothetical protein